MHEMEAFFGLNLELSYRSLKNTEKLNSIFGKIYFLTNTEYMYKQFPQNTQRMQIGRLPENIDYFIDQKSNENDCFGFVGLTDRIRQILKSNSALSLKFEGASIGDYKAEVYGKP